MKAENPRITASKPCLPPHSRGSGSVLLGPVLRDVSRSFYLTLRILPSQIRPQIGLAYLMARAADTIADTKIVPREQRLAALLQLRKQFEQTVSTTEIAEIQRDLSLHQSLPAEKQLLEKLDECFHIYSLFTGSDQKLIGDVVQTLTRGMEFDLTRFPGESPDQLAALEKPEELDQYIYYVAGCVGPFWTRMCMAHLRELKGWNGEKMEELGVRFGKGLQLCNVLRDIPRDLRIGRCYLPSSELTPAGLQPADLLELSAQEKLRPVYTKWLDIALGHLEAGWEYTMKVPGTLPKLRLACAWPILIGLKTLAKLRGNPELLHAEKRIKISRGEVYGIMARTYFAKRSESCLNRYHEELVQQAT